MTKTKQVKLLAYSSRIAWGFKAGLSFLLTSSLALIVWDEKAFSVFFPLFTIIGIMTDIVLYTRRHKIFSSFDIQDEDVPEEYGLTAEELVLYAKNISKIRLCRIPTSMLLFPLLLFSIKDSLHFAFTVSLLMNYYPAALADAFWAKKFGIKLPSPYKLILKSHFPGDIIQGTSITPFEDLERTKYMYGQISTYGCRNSILNPLNNSITPLSSPPIPSCLS